MAFDPSSASLFTESDKGNTSAPSAFDPDSARIVGDGEGVAHPEPKGFTGHVRDLGLSVLQGAIGVPEMAVGLADIPTGGAVGKALENKDGAFGFRPKQAREYLDTLKTDATQQQKKEFEQADGVIGKTAYALQNPSMIANAVAESLPMMGAGGVIGRGVMAAAPKVGAAMAAAAGEGVAAAGSAAEQIRQETADGNLTPTQSGLAVATGAATAGFGALGAKVANRLGIADADTLMVQGAKGLTGQATQQAALKSIPRKVVEGAIAEGFLEELPQSASEQILQNLALGKDWSEGVDSAIVMGTLAGVAMGGGAAGAQGMMQQKPGDQLLQADAERANEVTAAEARAAQIYQQRADFEAARQGQPEQNAPNPGLEMLRQAYAEQLRALQGQEAGEPDVPQSTPPDGRAVLEARQAESRAVMGPDDEILQSTGAAEPLHRAMGIDPAAGPLSTGAAIAVDTGVAGQMQAAAQAAQGQPAGGLAEAAQTEQEPPAAGFKVGETWSKPGAATYTIRSVSEDGKLAVVDFGRGETVTAHFDAEVANGWKPRLDDDAAPTPAQASTGQRWDGMSAEERSSVAGQMGLPPVIARNLPRAGWATLNPDLQARIAKAMAPATPAAAPSIEGADPGKGVAEAPAKVKPKNLVQLVRESGGVSLDRKADIDQDSRTVGVFRRGGMDLDGLAELLQQHGFMTDADVTDTTSGAERATELLRAALAGERVLSMNDADAVMEQDAEDRHRDEIRQKAAEYGIKTMFRPFADIERDVMAQDGELAPEDRSAYEYSEDIAYALEPLDDIDLQDARALSEEEQMRAMGFSEDEINEAINRASIREGQGATEQAQSGAAQESRDAGAQEDPGSEGSPEGLTDSRGERVTAEVAGTLGRGDILRDESGAEYYVWSARFGGAGSIEVVPFKDGKPVVYAGSSIRFALTPAAQEANPERRSDPLSLVKRAVIEPALTSYTNEDIARQEAAQRAAAAEAEKAQREADQKAQADAERDTFTLTGSDRPADVLAAQGQGGLFDAPAAAPTPKPQAAPAKADPGTRWDSMTAEQRAAILTQPGGWSTQAGGLNVIGKQLARKGWEQITDGTRGTITRLMGKARNQESIKNESRADAGPAPAAGPANQEAVKKPAGVKEAPPETESYNDGVRREMREARIRRLQEDRTITRANGKPFKTEASARAFSNDNELGNTHEAVSRDGGFVLQKRRRAADPETLRQEAAFARAEKIGPAAEAAVTAYENGDTSIEEFEAALDAAGEPAVGNAPSPLEALFSDLNSDSTRKANKARRAAAKLPQAARIDYVQANFHDMLIQMMEAGVLEVNGATTLTEDNAPCL